ncbi:MAG: hypothetical protein IIA63_03740 [Nitrospinae bacterium]|nr:hypothetical protein [Nitrospinota bacterium]
MTFSVIIALEILVISLIPIVPYQGQSDRTIQPISAKEFIGAVLGALLVFGVFGGFLLFPEYPIFRVLKWILCLGVALLLFLWTNKILKK